MASKSSLTERGHCVFLSLRSELSASLVNCSKGIGAAVKTSGQKCPDSVKLVRGTLRVETKSGRFV